MNYFIIGDIHGCYYTMRELIENHWDAASEKLVLLGDIVNKGKHTFAVLEHIINLQKKFPTQIVVLKGNNEYLFEKYYRDSITLAAKQKFENYNLDYLEVLDWIEKLPHYYENGKVFFSHAGVSAEMSTPVDNENIELIFNKKKLKNIHIRQFLGHVVVDEPTFDHDANAWYLDTGAGYGKKLCGAKTDKTGKISNLIVLDVYPKDIPRFN